MTIEQVDTLQRLARRLHAASLAVSGLSAGPDHDAVAELILDTAADLDASAESRRTSALALVALE